MPYLLSDSLRRQIVALLDQHGGGLPASTPGMRLPFDLANNRYLPFDIYWCKSTGKMRIYLPPNCCYMTGSVAAIDTTSLTAVEGMTDWYEFSTPTSATELYAIGTVETEGAAPKLKIAPADASTPDLRKKGLAFLLAKATPTGDRWNTRQYWHGAIGGQALGDPSVIGDSAAALGDLSSVEVTGAGTPESPFVE
jgi:hypothetical protein